MLRTNQNVFGSMVSNRLYGDARLQKPRIIASRPNSLRNGGVVVPPGCVSPVLSSFGSMRPTQEEAVVGDGGKVK